MRRSSPILASGRSFLRAAEGKLVRPELLALLLSECKAEQRPHRDTCAGRTVKGNGNFDLLLAFTATSLECGSLLPPSAGEACFAESRAQASSASLRTPQELLLFFRRPHVPAIISLAEDPLPYVCRRVS
jgi:hypothetical protein